MSFVCTKTTNAKLSSFNIFFSFTVLNASVFFGLLDWRYWDPSGPQVVKYTGQPSLGEFIQRCAHKLCQIWPHVIEHPNIQSQQDISAETSDNIEGERQREGRERRQQWESGSAWIKDDIHLVQPKHLCISPEPRPVWVILNTHDYCLLSITSGGAKWG